MVPHMSLRTVYSKWAERHRHPVSFALHLVGIPMTIAALPALVFCSVASAAALFIGGYALQFIGHIVERNKPGELLLIERILRRAGKNKPQGPQ